MRGAYVRPFQCLCWANVFLSKGLSFEPLAGEMLPKLPMFSAGNSVTSSWFEFDECSDEKHRSSILPSGGVAAGCNLFMHCDAAWQGSDEECRRLAEKALVSTGALDRCKPDGPGTGNPGGQKGRCKHELVFANQCSLEGLLYPGHFLGEVRIGVVISKIVMVSTLT